MPFYRARTITRLRLAAVPAGLLLFGATAAHADCGNPKDQAETTRCLGEDLSRSDRSINDTYGKLKNSLPDGEKTKLRDTQRAWIKERDAVCHVDETETDRRKWLAAVLKEPAKTVCVIRYSKQREAVLNASLLSNTVQAEPSASEGSYDVRSAGSHTTGKWYFEVTISGEPIAAKQDIQFSIGATDDSGTEGLNYLYSIHKGQPEPATQTVGIALDLDNGRIYTSRDGVWSADPGSSAGDAIKLNHAYHADLGSSSDMTALAKAGLIKTDFGDKPFTYALPAGYKPFAQ